ncbi:MAG: outer membrane beta-barrel protein [Rickettsiales bacterium]|jgi:opacity protein-like surface antigen|nr:outer membrane beta-barrel protein [Rickettsiales bacterium]
MRKFAFIIATLSAFGVRAQSLEEREAEFQAKFGTPKPASIAMPPPEAVVVEPAPVPMTSMGKDGGYIAARLLAYRNMDVDVSLGGAFALDATAKPGGLTLAYGSKSGELRTEGELIIAGGVKVEAIRETDNFKASALMLNGYYDFGNTSVITPYVGIGFGITLLSAEFDLWGRGGPTILSGASIREAGFGWQVMLGANADVSERIAVEFGWRHISYGELSGGMLIDTGINTIATTAIVDVEANAFYLGMKFKI